MAEIEINESDLDSTTIYWAECSDCEVTSDEYSDPDNAIEDIRGWRKIGSRLVCADCGAKYGLAAQMTGTQ